MTLVVPVLLALLSSARAVDPEVTAMSFAGEVFREAFNAARSQSRLVVILSPT